MVSKRAWLSIAYISAFFSVFLLSILYSILPTIFKLDMNWLDESTWDMSGNAWIIEANATISGTATSMSYLPTIGMVIAVAIVVSLLLGGFSMKMAIE